MNGLALKRKERKLTHKQLADSLGLPIQTYRNYEYGKREPKIEILKLMAKYFSCTIDELL